MTNSSEITRRSFLALVGTGAATLALSETRLHLFGNKVEAATTFFSSKTKQLGSFTSLDATLPTKLTVSKEFTADTLKTNQLSLKNGAMGRNHSFCSFFPEGTSNVNGLLWISHDSAPNANMQLQGGTVLEVMRDTKGSWNINPESSFNKRISNFDPFSFTGLAAKSKGLKGAAITSGTVGNELGSQTPWGTVLTGEDNYEETCRLNGLDISHYGWVTEIDPYQEVKTMYKHTALGRFRHGALDIVTSKNNRLVVYMGSDEEGGCLFKYVSDQVYHSSEKKSSSSLLTSGTLYAANLEHGEWIPLQIKKVQKVLNNLRSKLPNSIKKTREQLKAQFRSEADVLIFAQEAALLLGATPMDRPVGVKYHTPDMALYITQSGNIKHGNFHGAIVKIKEDKNDPGAAQFVFENLSNSGVIGEISTPADLHIDSKGNMWISTAIPVEKVGKGVYQSFQNNGLFMVNPKGDVKQFAAAPTGSEITGFSFTPDERTLFMTVKNINNKTAEIIAVRGF